MLILKPLSEDRGRLTVQKSCQLLSLRISVCHPHTCTYVRLLGPCFKTGRIKPFRQHRGVRVAVGSLTHRHTGKPAWQPRSTFTIDWSPHTQASVKARVVVSELSTPAEVQPNTRLFLEPELTLTLEASNIARVRIKTPSDACADAKGHHHSTQQARQENWFYSLPFQRFQALLTLFSKSFSPFPHGTCLLSVSSPYLALGEIYHPLCAQVPMNATRRKRTVRAELLMTDGTLTLSDALFQETYISVHTGSTSKDYNSTPRRRFSR